MSTPPAGRERAANYISISNTIADTYPCELAHGFQKDAIQNSVDARRGSASPVKVEFRIVRNEKGVFLTVTDRNTTGLTGDVKYDKSDYEKLQPDDHWARFEAFAFTKTDANALGARGQGKFIFLCASEEYKMFYDTLRIDGVYRLGGTEATMTGCPIYPEGDTPWEDDVARDELRKQFGLAPLREVGTRVIICNPRKEILAAIGNGDMQKAIQETWFRSMQKNQLEVSMRVEGRVDAVDLPGIYALPRKDSKSQKVWVLDSDFTDAEFTVPSGEKYKIKHFHAAYLEEETVPDELQGIAVVQNGMKITSLPMNMAPANVGEKITGFIEFDRELDKELRKGTNQHPNHYNLKWRASVPRGIKAFVSRQLNAFGKAKLGLGEDPREQKNRRRGNAEELAMRQLQRYAKDLKLFGPSKPRPGPRPVPVPTPPAHKEKGLSFRDFFIPNEGLRVNWDEKITFSLWAFNKTADAVKCRTALRVLHGDSEIVTLLDNESFVLEANSNKSVNDPFILDIEKSRYKDVGEHRVKAVLMDAQTGEEIDSLTRKFWVETNPPMRQPFELQPAPLGPTRAWAADSDNMRLLYNTDHPEYQSVEDDEEAQADYLFRVCLEGALCFVLARAFDDNPDYTPLNTEAIAQDDKDMIPGATYDEAMSYISAIRWNIYQEGL